MRNLYAHIVRCGIEFEWDERKRAQVIAERALDFNDADVFFEAAR
jgi:uncharacterized DUF497 family protein